MATFLSACLREVDTRVHYWISASEVAHRAQGQSLGSAAHLRSLRREAIGDFSVEDAWDFQRLLELATERKAEQRAAQQHSSEEHG